MLCIVVGRYLPSMRSRSSLFSIALVTATLAEPSKAMLSETAQIAMKLHVQELLLCFKACCEDEVLALLGDNHTWRRRWGSNYFQERLSSLHTHHRWTSCLQSKCGHSCLSKHDGVEPAI